MDRKNKDGFWLGILLSFFVIFSVFTFITLGKALEPSDELQFFAVLYLLGDGTAFVIGLYVVELFWK